MNPDGLLGRDDEHGIDLHALLTDHKPSVSLMAVHTNIMKASGLPHGSIAVIDRSLKPEKGRVVAVRYNNGVVIRRLDHRAGLWCLVSDDPREDTLFITEDDVVERLGTVTWSLIKMP